MLNPITQKITDLKFSVKRLESECEALGYESTQTLLAQARTVLDQAILSMDQTSSALPITDKHTVK